MARVVSIHYTLTNDEGEVLDSSKEQGPLSYLEGVGQIIPGLEDALSDSKKGDKKKVRVAAEHAYGERSPENILEIPRDRFPEGEIAVGDQFHMGSPGGQGHMPVVVTEVTKAQVTVDANHPLAGVDLTFDVEVVEIRNATAEETEHGHAHGPDGHHQH